VGIRTIPRAQFYDRGRKWTKRENLRRTTNTQTPKHGNWAFQYPRSFSPESDIWHNTIPNDTDIVVTHGPALGHVDGKRTGVPGCALLLRELWRVKPKVHVCGHIPEARGVETVDWGYVQWGRDSMCLGDGSWKGVSKLVVLLVAWMWSWTAHALLDETGKKSRTTFIRAAFMRDGGVVSGERVVVIEI
jgi:hypothetical protein